MSSELPDLNKPYPQSVGFLDLNQPPMGVPTTDFWEDDWDDSNHSSEEEAGTIDLQRTCDATLPLDIFLIQPGFIQHHEN